MFRLLSAALLSAMSLSSVAQSADAQLPIVDANGDGLIEINSLQDLHAIRADLTGRTFKGSSRGCPIAGCTGFELTRDLDFDTNGNGRIDAGDEFWNNGFGWLPLGADQANPYSEGVPLTAKFDGRGHSIRNLHINRSLENMGLFAHLSVARVSNLSLDGASTRITNTMKNLSAANLHYEGTATGLLAGSIYASVITDVFLRGFITAHSGTVGMLAGRSLYNGVLQDLVTAGRIEICNRHEPWFRAGGDLGLHAGGFVGATYEDWWFTFASTVHITNAPGCDGPDYAGGLFGAVRHDIESRYGYSGGSVGAHKVAGAIAARTEVDTIEALALGRITSGEVKTILGEEGGFIPAWISSHYNNLTVAGRGAAMPLERWNCDFESPDCYKRAANLEYALSPGEVGQLPAPLIGKRVYRDTDGDGYFDFEDIDPINPAIAVDTDGDGLPDVWPFNCDSACRSQSGLWLDQFPRNSEASVDADLDGLPDAFHANCDSACQAASGLVLDQHLLDADNDGVPDASDTNTAGRTNADRDGNGLIEINSLTRLNAIRHDLQGHGLRLTAGGPRDSSGCPVVSVQGEPVRQCHGYELTADLNFDTNADGRMNALDTYWNNGAGFLPIGSLNEPFSAVFEGNGNRILNLYINRPDHYSAGLFAATHSARIQHLALTGPLSKLHFNTGGLVVGRAVNTELRGIWGAAEMSARSSLGGLIDSAQNTTITASFFSGQLTGPRPYAIAGSMFGGALNASLVSATLTPTLETSFPGNALAGNFEAATNSRWLRFANSVFLPDSLSATPNQLRCPTAAVDSLCASASIYKNWDQQVDPVSGEPYWEFGNSSQLPGLKLKGRTYRDSDGDGIIDADDLYPLNTAAALDSDKDGAIDAFHPSCDSQCQAASGLLLDRFVMNAAASLDSDGDGYPDSWNTSCGAACQLASGLTIDAFPNDKSVALDANQDGLPDRWNANCDQACRSASAFAAHFANDAGAPEITRVPADQTLFATQALTRVTLSSEGLAAQDQLDLPEALRFEASFNGRVVMPGTEVSLPSGVHKVNWVAIDTSGNRSAVVAQTFTVYPAVGFTELEYQVGQGATAQLPVSILGQSPVYPVVLTFAIDNAAALPDGLLTDPDAPMTLTIESLDAQSEASLTLAINDLHRALADTPVRLVLQGASAGLDTPIELNIVSDLAAMDVLVSDANLPPEAVITLTQNDVVTTEIGRLGGRATLAVAITDVNPRDTHSLRWDLTQLELADSTRSSRVFDPYLLEPGTYAVQVTVTDSAIPPASITRELSFTVIEGEGGVASSSLASSAVSSEVSSAASSPASSAVASSVISSQPSSESSAISSAISSTPSSLPGLPDGSTISSQPSSAVASSQPVASSPAAGATSSSDVSVTESSVATSLATSSVAVSSVAASSVPASSVAASSVAVSSVAVSSVAVSSASSSTAPKKSGGGGGSLGLLMLSLLGVLSLARRARN